MPIQSFLTYAPVIATYRGDVVSIPADVSSLSAASVRPHSPRRVKPSDLIAAWTPLTLEDTRISYDSSTVRDWDLEGNTVWHVSGPSSYWSPFASPYGDEYNSADLTDLEGRMRLAIKSQNINLAQTLAEYRQTSKMLVSLCNNIHHAYRSLRTGYLFAEFIRALQNPRTPPQRRLADKWLEYQYGWRPLMSDIYGSADQLIRELNNGVVRRERLSSTATHSDTFSTSLFSVRRQRTTRISMIAEYTVSSAGMQTLAQCGISNPALLAWELIPYSHVVDWVFPVGNFLKSIDALAGVSGLKVGTAISVRTTADRSFVPPPPGSRESRASGAATFKKRYYERRPLSSGLSMPRLDYKPSTSLTAVLNGLAHLTQLRSR